MKNILSPPPPPPVLTVAVWVVGHVLFLLVLWWLVG